MPFKPLMSYSKCVTIAGRNDLAAGCRATSAVSKIKPSSQSATRSFHIIETHVNVALDVISVRGLDIRAGARQIAHCKFTNSEIQVLEACAITAHVKRIEIIDLNMLPPVASLPRPELPLRLPP